MTEIEAKKKGYEFTGCYSHWKDEVVKRKNDYKNEGYKTVIINEKASGYEKNGHRKGSIIGYSLYIEPKYFVDRKKEELRKSIDSFQERAEKLKAEYESKLSQMIVELAAQKVELNKLENEVTK